MPTIAAQVLSLYLFVGLVTGSYVVWRGNDTSSLSGFIAAAAVAIMWPAIIVGLILALGGVIGA